jgi:hypothetical protein
MLVPAQRAWGVGDLRAEERAVLPDAERGARGVKRDRHPANVHDIHRVHQQLAAGPLDLRGRGVGVLRRQEGRPGGGRPGRALQRPDPGHGLAVQVRYRVATHFWPALLDVPAELRGVESNGLRYVADTEVDPARRPCWPWGVAGNHISPPYPRRHALSRTALSLTVHP